MINPADTHSIQTLVQARHAELNRSASGRNPGQSPPDGAAPDGPGVVRSFLGQWLIKSGSRLAGAYDREICVPCLDGQGECATAC